MMQALMIANVVLIDQSQPKATYGSKGRGLKSLFMMFNEQTVRFLKLHDFETSTGNDRASNENIFKNKMFQTLLKFSKMPEVLYTHRDTVCG